MSSLTLLFDQHGAFFLFFLIAFTDAGLPIPIPYDFVILLGGYRGLPLWQVLLAVVSGALLGNSILYFLARTFGYRFLERYERFFLFSHATHQKMERWFLKFGPLVIILARLVPGLRFAGSFIAGILKFPYKRAFLPSMVVASFLWAISYYFLGKALGEGIFYLTRFESHFRTFSFLPIVVILSIIVLSFLRIKTQRGKTNKD